MKPGVVIKMYLMTMQAIILDSPGQQLKLKNIPVPELEEGEVLVKVKACGVCRTDLHVVDGDLHETKFPIIPGHEIVGEIVQESHSIKWKKGDRVVIPWLGKTCSNCRFCATGRENLCDFPTFTGYTTDGGFAQFCKANDNFCFAAPRSYSDIGLAPLVCAGLIGWRCYEMAGDCDSLGIFGFGAAAHIVTQVALYENRKVFAFTRNGDVSAQKFALELGATWSGDCKQKPPVKLDAAIIFAPVGELVPRALDVVAKGGVVVCGGIHMSDIPTFSYSLLWGERQIKSVANLTRLDGLKFFDFVGKHHIKTKVKEYSLEHAQDALNDLRMGKFTGAAVIVP